MNQEPAANFGSPLSSPFHAPFPSLPAVPHFSSLAAASSSIQTNRPLVGLTLCAG